MATVTDRPVEGRTVKPSNHPALVRSVVGQSGADSVIRLGGPRLDHSGFLQAPGQDPILTRYAFAPGVACSRLADWALTLGDVEVF
jgi:hypothetical protein